MCRKVRVDALCSTSVHNNHLHDAAEQEKRQARFFLCAGEGKRFPLNAKQFSVPLREQIFICLDSHYVPQPLQ